MRTSGAQPLSDVKLPNVDNPLQSLTKLRHTYFGIRHRKSVANVEGTIRATMDSASKAYGVVPGGNEMYRTAQALLRQPEFEHGLVMLLNSKLMRTIESAKELVNGFGTGFKIATPLSLTSLNERDHGQLEGHKTCVIPVLESLDELSPFRGALGAESRAAMANRVLCTVLNCEENIIGAATVILLSHSGPLRIIEDAFTQRASVCPNRITPFAYGEVRRFKLGEGASWKFVP